MPLPEELRYKRAKKQSNMDRYLEIVRSDESEADRIVQAFLHVTQFYIDQADKDIEISRALDDKEERIKVQIKRSVMLHTQDIIKGAYQQVTGKKVQDDDKS
jgi:hypothetical protein